MERTECNMLAKDSVRQQDSRTNEERRVLLAEQRFFESALVPVFSQYKECPTKGTLKKQKRKGWDTGHSHGVECARYQYCLALARDKGDNWIMKESRSHRLGFIYGCANVLAKPPYKLYGPICD